MRYAVGGHGDGDCGNGIARGPGSTRFVEPGRAAGERTVTVRAGDVQRQLGWWNRVPSVCSALDAREFQRMSRTRLVQRRGPAQSTTAEWVFALTEALDEPGRDPALAAEAAGVRRLVAVWDGVSFQPSVTPEGMEPGQKVVLAVSPVREARELAGEFGRFVGTLSEAEAAAMQDAIDQAFETISDEW
jgi:hypothetical protein